MKLSKAQQKVLDKVLETLEVCKKYATYQEFFDNSKGEQNHFTTAFHRGISFEEYAKRFPELCADMEQSFYKAKNENTLIVFAKTETIKAMAKAGVFEIVEEAQFKGGAETVKVLAFC